MTQRFDGYIHSIVGHQIMVSPNGSASEQYKCALDDFESIMPAAGVNTSNGYIQSQLFTFHVKRDRIGVEHYRQWLGLAKIENDRLASIENGLLKLIKTLPVVQPAPAKVADPDDVQGMAARLMS